MRILGSLFASPLYQQSVSFTHERLFSLRSLVFTTIAKSRVLVRLILGKYHVDGRAIDTTSRQIILKTKDSIGTLQTSAQTNRIVNSWLIGQKGFVRRIVARWINNSLNADLRKNTLLGGGGLSLGLVGVCVKRNGTPSLLTEQDEIESVCQQIRTIFSAHRDDYFTRAKIDENLFRLDNLTFGSCIAKGCNAVVYDASLKSDPNMNFAVKMMFNYDAESNAGAILSAMNKECVPFSGEFAADDELAEWVKNHRVKLEDHPNIVEIYGVFADFTPCLKDAFTLYPDALPSRINEYGYGRNMTLFLAMKRYDMSLKDYLSTEKPQSRTSLLMLTQLLEAVSFLSKNKIAHRDLKCDNILLNLEQGFEEPWLVVTDFGSCITQLSMPFTSEEMNRGGNRALMAPEIITAMPGSFVYINYTASDVWAVGAIAFELFAGRNPFYSYQDKKEHLTSATYEESCLPEKPSSMPSVIYSLVLNLLKRNPNERPEAKIATTASHIVLHSSNKALGRLLDRNTNAKKLLHWLTKSIALTTICQRKSITNGEKLSQVELKLRNMFLSQVKIENLIQSLQYLHVN